MYMVKMNEKQEDDFTHPREFVVDCWLNDIEETIREHGYKGKYTYRVIPYLRSKEMKRKLSL